MVLFDMVGDRDLTIKRETDSTRWLTDLIWASARRLGQRAFLAEDFAVEDDHRPFLDAGVPAVDIIDLDYAAWHTRRRHAGPVSARSLQTVGDVFLDALPQHRGAPAALGYRLPCRVCDSRPPTSPSTADSRRAA